MNRNYIVSQSKKLVAAKHTKPLTLREQKIILTMVSMIQPNDENFKDYHISLKDFTKLLKLKGKTKYSEIKKITKELASKTIEIPKENGGWVVTTWLSSAEYIVGQGTIALSFSPKLKPYLLQLKSFTQYRLSTVLSLDSNYSVRLYELLKLWEFKGDWECSIELLREKMGAQKKSYSLYGNFKNIVIVNSITELNEKTDLSVSFEEVKTGRKVTALKFKMKSATKEEPKDEEGSKKEGEEEKLKDEEGSRKEGEEEKPKDEEGEEEQQKKTPKFEELRQKLNSLTEGYEFDIVYFNDLYKTMTLLFPGKEEEELMFLIGYVNKEKGIKSPLGFIKTKLKSAYEIVKVMGVEFSFSSLKNQTRNTREEVIPAWFNESSPVSEPEKIENIAEMRDKLLKEFESGLK